MSRTVHKFPINPGGNGWFEIDLPRSAKPVLVAAQMGAPCMWVELDPDKPRDTRRFQLVGTGHPVADGLEHVGSFLANNGAFVWHVYEARP